MRKECEQLWADILRAGSTDEIGVHFIGSVVHIDDGLGNIAVQAPKLVIDGQQRLTTVTLLLSLTDAKIDASVKQPLVKALAGWASPALSPKILVVRDNASNLTAPTEASFIRTTYSENSCFR